MRNATRTALGSAVGAAVMLLGLNYELIPVPEQLGTDVQFYLM